MQVSQINSLNFKGLYIDGDIALPMLFQAERFLHTNRDMKICADKMDQCKKTKYSDVFVTKDGKIYVKDKKTKQRVYTATDKPLFYQFYLALTKAIAMDECYKKGKDPYELIL